MENVSGRLKGGVEYLIGVSERSRAELGIPIDAAMILAAEGVSIRPGESSARPPSAGLVEGVVTTRGPVFRNVP